MELQPPNRIKELRKVRGVTQEALAEAVGTSAQHLGRIESRTRKLTTEWMEKIAKALKVEVKELLPGTDENETKGTVPLVGYVGAGALYYPSPDHGPWVGFDEVEAPPGDNGDVVAVRVRGDSMYPVFRDGDLLYFRKDPASPPHRYIGKDCIIQTLGGAAYIKRLEKDGHKYRLASYNAPDMPGVEVEWASPVIWIQRE